MAQTDVKRGQIARDLMKDDPQLSEAVALAQADDMIKQGLADVAEADPFEGVGSAENDPFAGVGMVEAEDPFAGVGTVEEKPVDWTPPAMLRMPGTEVPAALSPEQTTPLSAMDLEQGLKLAVESGKGAERDEAIAAEEERVRKITKSPYFLSRDEKNKEALNTPTSYWGTASQAGAESATTSPDSPTSSVETQARMANANETVKEATEKQGGEQTWETIVESMAKDLYVSGQVDTIEEAKKQARDTYDGNVAEGMTTVAMMFLPVVGAAAAPAWAARFAKLSLKGKAAALAAAGASESTIAGLMGNLAAGRDPLDGLEDDAILGATVGAAVPVVGKAVGKVVDKVSGIPSKAAREVAEAQPRVAELEKQVIKEQTALQNKYLNELDAVPSRSDVRRANLDDATIEGAYPGYNKMVKQLDEATTAKDEAIAVLKADKEEALTVLTSKSQREAVAKKMDEQIATVEARYADDVARIESQYTDELGTLTRDREDMRGYLDRDDDAVRDALSIDFLNQSDAAYNKAMRGEKVLGDMDASDFVAMRNKMRMVEEINKQGGMVGTGTVAKQMTKGGKASDFLSDARSSIETVAGGVSDKSKWLADATGLRTPGIETARKTAVVDIADDFLDNIDNMRYSGKMRGSDETEKAIDYLRRRVEATKKGDTKATQKIEKEFDKHYDTLRTAGVKPDVIGELGKTSNDLKALRKVAQDTGKDVSESPTAGWAGSAIGVGVDVLTGTPGMSTILAAAGGKIAQMLGKAGLNKWVSKSAKGRFDELNKAFNGQLTWNKEIEALIKSGATPVKVATYVVATEGVDIGSLEM